MPGSGLSHRLRATVAAGLQLALWNAVYDDDNTVDSGLFKASSGSSGIITNANAYLVAAAGYTDDPKWKLILYDSATDSGKRSQNLVSVSPVPLPAAGFLMLGALASLGIMGYRRRATTPVVLSDEEKSQLNSLAQSRSLP